MQPKRTRSSTLCISLIFFKEASPLPVLALLACCTKQICRETISDISPGESPALTRVFITPAENNLSIGASIEQQLTELASLSFAFSVRRHCRLTKRGMFVGFEMKLDSQ